VHAGLLEVGESALIRVEFLPGLEQYPAAEAHGISSRIWSQWSTSIRLSRVVEQRAGEPFPVEEERLNNTPATESGEAAPAAIPIGDQPKVRFF
jgi:hypothetical protein